MKSISSRVTMAGSPPLRGRVRDDVLLFFKRIQVLDIVGDDALLHNRIRGLDDTELIRACVKRHAKNKADVLTFRRVDRTKASVVGRVHVADFEARALAREAAGAERGERAHVLELREDVLLVHELRELVGREEFAH